MYERTLSGLLRLGDSYYAKNIANWMYIKVSVDGQESEIIINPKVNFESKLKYYEEAYNEDLTLKTKPVIQIVNYDFVESFDEIDTTTWN